MSAARCRRCGGAEPHWASWRLRRCLAQCRAHFIQPSSDRAVLLESMTFLVRTVPDSSTKMQGGWRHRGEQAQQQQLSSRVRGGPACLDLLVIATHTPLSHIPANKRPRKRAPRPVRSARRSCRHLAISLVSKDCSDAIEGGRGGGGVPGDAGGSGRGSLGRQAGCPPVRWHR